MPSIAEARPPYVSFETRRVEKQRSREHPTEPGMLYVEEIDFVKVTPQGSKDMFEKEVSDWMTNLQMRVSMQMESPEVLEKYQKKYQAWKENKEIPLDGTPIRGWPLLTESQQQTCISLNLRTVEDLANCNSESTNRLGMGGQMFRTRAENFLIAKKDTGPLVAKVEAMGANLAAVMEELNRLRDENKILKGAVGLGQARSAPIGMELGPEEDKNLIDDVVDEEIGR